MFHKTFVINLVINLKPHVLYCK